MRMQDQSEAESCRQKLGPATFAATIDQQALTDLWEDMDRDENFMCELIRLYLEDTPKQLISARQALAAADAKTLGRIAHTLKGNSLYYGARNLSTICRELESVCEQGEFAKAGWWVQELAKEFDLVKEALQSRMTKKQWTGTFRPTHLPPA